MNKENKFEKIINNLLEKGAFDSEILEALEEAKAPQEEVEKFKKFIKIRDIQESLLDEDWEDFLSLENALWEEKNFRDPRTNRVFLDLTDEEKYYRGW